MSTLQLDLPYIPTGPHDLPQECQANLNLCICCMQNKQRDHAQISYVLPIICTFLARLDAKELTLETKTPQSSRKKQKVAALPKALLIHIQGSINCRSPVRSDRAPFSYNGLRCTITVQNHPLSINKITTNITTTNLSRAFSYLHPQVLVNQSWNLLLFNGNMKLLIKKACGSIKSSSSLSSIPFYETNDHHTALYKNHHTLLRVFQQLTAFAALS